jgi:hypothetical protein
MEPSPKAILLRGNLFFADLRHGRLRCAEIRPPAG